MATTGLPFAECQDSPTGTASRFAPSEPLGLVLRAVPSGLTRRDRSSLSITELLEHHSLGTLNCPQCSRQRTQLMVEFQARLTFLAISVAWSR